MVLRLTLILFAIVAGHALRETARDTLFLTGLPASRLPYAYLAIAALAVLVGWGQRRFLGDRPPRSVLRTALVVGAGVDGLLWFASRGGAPGALFALYVWTGLLATVVLVQFWLQVANRFDVDQAKRSFSVISAGGLLGAVAGSAGAAALLEVLETRALLLASSAAFGGAALLSLLVGASPSEREAPARTLGPAASSPVLADGYHLRLLALALGVAVLATGIDFLFKSVVSQEIDPRRLGAFFARFNVAIGVAALVLQLLVAPRVIQSLGVVRTLGILPAALIGASGAAAAAVAVLPVAIAKGLDGAFRHSLHRSAAEILYLPVDPGARTPLKTLVDSLGQRGGQAVASLAILAALGAGLEQRTVALALVGVGAACLVTLTGLRRGYVERFRARLRVLDPDTRSAVPELDLHSLEALVSALSSRNDAEVVAALDLLEAYGKTHLVSPLILLHPSRQVVLHALDALSRRARPDLQPMLERLLEHPDPDVRAAVVQRSVPELGAGGRLLRSLRDDPSERVRSSALVAWFAGREPEPAAVAELLERVVRSEDSATLRAVARLIPRLPAADARRWAGRLIDRDASVAADVAAALSERPRVESTPLLLELLAHRGARPAARAALLELGDAAEASLTRALCDPATPERVRSHLPRTLSPFGSEGAAAVLLDNLAPSSPRVRYKILRGLGRMRADDPTLAMDPEPLLSEAERSLERAITMLHFRVAYAAWASLRPERVRRSRGLLGPLFEEKEHRALERVFRALHVLDPEQSYAAIFQALRRPGTPHHAISRELIEHVVKGPLSDGILSLVEPGSPADRLASALAFAEPEDARTLVEWISAAGSEPDGEGRRAGIALVTRILARIESDPDPILVSVARSELQAGAWPHGGVADGA